MAYISKRKLAIYIQPYVLKLNLRSDYYLAWFKKKQNNRKKNT